MAGATPPPYSTETQFLKCVYKGVVIRLAHPANFESLLDAVVDKFHTTKDVTIRYVDPSKDLMTIQDNTQLEFALTDFVAPETCVRLLVEDKQAPQAAAQPSPEEKRPMEIEVAMSAQPISAASPAVVMHLNNSESKSNSNNYNNNNSNNGNHSNSGGSGGSKLAFERPEQKKAHMFVSTKSQYTVQSVSGCTIMALEAALHLLSGREPSVELINHVLATGGYYTSDLHTDLDEIFPEVSRYFLNLSQVDQIRVSVENLSAIVGAMQQSREKSQRGVSAVLTKPPESVSLHLLGPTVVTEFPFFLFDSHRRDLHDGAALIGFRNEREVTDYLEQLFPPLDLGADASNLMLSMYNQVDASFLQLKVGSDPSIGRAELLPREVAELCIQFEKIASKKAAAAQRAQENQLQRVPPPVTPVPPPTPARAASKHSGHKGSGKSGGNSNNYSNNNNYNNYNYNNYNHNNHNNHNNNNYNNNSGSGGSNWGGANSSHRARSRGPRRWAQTACAYFMGGGANDGVPSNAPPALSKRQKRRMQREQECKTAAPSKIVVPPKAGAGGTPKAATNAATVPARAAPAVAAARTSAADVPPRTAAGRAAIARNTPHAASPAPPAIVQEEGGLLDDEAYALQLQQEFALEEAKLMEDFRFAHGIFTAERNDELANERLAQQLLAEEAQEQAKLEREARQAEQMVQDEAMARALEQQRFECNICFEQKAIDDVFELPDDCEHDEEVCRDCARQWVLTSIGDSCFPIPCPLRVCSSFIHPDSCQLILDEGEIAKFFQLSLNHWADGSQDAYHCPTPNCKGLVCVDKGNSTYAQCPVCQCEWCVDCQTAWHRDSSCKQYQEWRAANDPEGKQVEALMKVHKYRICPNCKSGVEKIEGCNHMTCRCKSHFCYLCGIVLDPAHPYDHFNQQGPCSLFNLDEPAYRD